MPKSKTEKTEKEEKEVGWGGRRAKGGVIEDFVEIFMVKAMALMLPTTPMMMTET